MPPAPSGTRTSKLPRRVPGCRAMNCVKDCMPLDSGVEGAGPSPSATAAVSVSCVLSRSARVLAALAVFRLLVLGAGHVLAALLTFVNVDRRGLILRVPQEDDRSLGLLVAMQ